MRLADRLATVAEPAARGAMDREEDPDDDDEIEGHCPPGLEDGRGLAVARPLIPVRVTELDHPVLGEFTRL